MRVCARAHALRVGTLPNVRVCTYAQMRVGISAVCICGCAYAYTSVRACAYYGHVEILEICSHHTMCVVYINALVCVLYTRGRMSSGVPLNIKHHS